MGFLGSGKTTSILGLARYLTSDEGKSVAILVNEAGEIPIDGAVLEAGGHEVRELFAGCICLVASDLVAAMADLSRRQGLDYIIVEPSGMANARRLVYLLGQLGFSPVGQAPIPGCTLSKRVTIVDAARFDVLYSSARFLVAGSVEVADVVLLNKADLIDEESQRHIMERIRRINRAAPIHPVSAIRGIPGSIWNTVVDDGF
jgi:G3E family GTPase